MAQRVRKLELELELELEQFGRIREKFEKIQHAGLEAVSVAYIASGNNPALRLGCAASGVLLHGRTPAFATT